MFLIIAFTFHISASDGQSYYYPPIQGDTWATIDPVSLGWCPEAIADLDDFLEQKGTKAFIVLKDGKMVIEHYYGEFTQDSIWYWASAGKSLAAFMVGMAQEKGILNIQDKSSTYLGQGWTSLGPLEEGKIKIWHQLTMTTGLDDGVPDPDCLLPECLVYKAGPGTRWAYHNAAYRKVQDVVANAWGNSFQHFMTTQLTLKTGISGLWYDYILYSKPRSLARFGSLVLNNGTWNGTKVLGDQSYIEAMRNTSQNLNEAYGYLWWLNGKSSFMVPVLRNVFSGPLIQEAPSDMYCALGKNDQKIYIIPSTNMVIVRMGNEGGQITGAVSSFDNLFWAEFNKLSCTSSVQSEQVSPFRLSPNPFDGTFYVDTPNAECRYRIINLRGQTVQSGRLHQKGINTIHGQLASGVYIVHFMDDSGSVITTQKVVKI